MPYSVQNTQPVEQFDSCFQVIASFMDALQRNFKEDTHYAYPLMPPQANTMYVLDEVVSQSMKSYISLLIKNACGFADDEFRVTVRTPDDSGGLHKLRLEFCNGITFDMIQRIMEKTTELEERVVQRKQSQ